MSGSGIWCLVLKGDESKGYEVEGRRLMGIAYYETAERLIVGHGGKSIYERLLPQLQAL